MVERDACGLVIDRDAYGLVIDRDACGLACGLVIVVDDIVGSGCTTLCNVLLSLLANAIPSDVEGEGGCNTIGLIVIPFACNALITISLKR